jgi:DNA-binding LytR/AlgR family response regulator
LFYIAICDDDEQTCIEIEKCISDHFSPEKVKASSFFCGEDLLASISQGYSFDLIFLDIELKEMNGVETGKIIRSELHNEKMHIAYLSANTQYAIELFQVRPLDFLIKPYSEEQIVKTIEKARNNCKSISFHALLVTTNKIKIYTIVFSTFSGFACSQKIGI